MDKPTLFQQIFDALDGKKKVWLQLPGEEANPRAEGYNEGITAAEDVIAEFARKAGFTPERQQD